MLQNKSIKEIDLTKETITNVSADKAWNIIGPGFAEAGKWATAVDHSSGTGKGQFEGAACDARSCDVSAIGFSQTNEKLVNYSDKDKYLAYDVIEGMPEMIAQARNEWKVIPINANQCKVVMNSNLGVQGFMGKLMSGIMKIKMSKLVDISLTDLKV